MGQTCSQNGMSNITAVFGNETNSFNRSLSLECTSSNSSLNFAQGFVTVLADSLQEIFTEKVTAAFNIFLLYLRVLFAVALLGNLATLLVLAQSRPWSAWKVYVMVLSVTDTMVLLVKLIMAELNLIQHKQSSTCHLFLFFGVTLTEFSHWVLVCMTVERFAVVWFPLHISGDKLTRVYRVLLVLAVFLPLHNMVYFWFRGDAWNSITLNNCPPSLEYEVVVEHFWKWIRVSIYGVIPCAMVITANFCTIGGWMMSNRRHRKLTGADNKPGAAANNAGKHVQITLMVLSVSACFALVVIPHTIFMIALPEFMYNGSSEEVDHAFLMFVLTIVFSDLNYCCNFFLFSATSRNFRNEAKRLFSERRWCKIRAPATKDAVKP